MTCQPEQIGPEQIGLELLNLASFLRDDTSGLTHDDDESENQDRRHEVARGYLAWAYTSLKELPARTETVNEAIGLVVRAWNELPGPGVVLFRDGQYVENLLERVSQRFGENFERLGARLVAESDQTVDCGPAEAEAYVPASTLWQKEFATYKRFKSWLDKIPKAVVGRRSPSPRRLEIHAGDWARYWASRDSDSFDAMDEATIADAAAEVREKRRK